MGLVGLLAGPRKLLHGNSIYSPEKFNHLDQRRIRSEQGRMKFYFFFAFFTCFDQFSTFLNISSHLKAFFTFFHFILFF